jgi:hypothetical protein
MREVADFLKANDAYFLLGLSALSLILIICTASMSRRLTQISRRRNARLEDGRLGDIIDCLNDQSQALSSVQTQLEEVRIKQSEHGQAIVPCLSNIGIVRFNAFDDVGGDQSFAVVLLDSDRNGVAFSSLYGRQDSRIYAKAIYNGEGERPLSAEEQQALAKALK